MPNKSLIVLIIIIISAKNPDEAELDEALQNVVIKMIVLSVVNLPLLDDPFQIC